MGDMDEVIVEFLIESKEGLDQLDRDLVALESDGANRDLLGRVFRVAHTIKGTAGFLGFKSLESLTHAGESLLAKLRDRELSFSKEIADALLATFDAVREMLCEVEVDGTDGGGDYSALVERLKGLMNGDPAPVAAPPPPAPPPPPALPPPAPRDDIRNTNSSMEVFDALMPAFTTQEPASPKAAPEAGGHDTRAAESIRVDVQLMDKLMDLAGELVLTRNQVVQLSSARSMGNGAMGAAAQRLNLITSELQDGIMKMRMQPIDNVFAKFPRMVRDLAAACGKAARIEIEGKNTELDKTLIEAIKDPLTHLLRNAIDHGLETPDFRIERGKKPEGKLTIRAFHEGGQVHIELVDDGGGIPLEKIKAKAIERGLITSEQGDRMTQPDLINLIFLPGFSTAQAVTNVSGRGVGMDVVKTNVERIGGTIDVQTAPGQGTTFRLKIPLTLAIVPGLIVSCAGARYAIPQVSLQELVRIDGEKVRERIEFVHGAPVFRLRGRLLPVVSLRHEMGIDHEPIGVSRESLNMAVLEAGRRTFGLIVDRIVDTQEIVVKPMAAQLKGVPIFAGATILGDGKVALILDVPGLARRASVMQEGGATGQGLASQSSAGPAVPDTAYLLLRSADDGRMAIPLDAVSRLEVFPRSAMERVGDRTVVQYRNEILNLLEIGELIPERRSQPRVPVTSEPDQELVNVVVFERGERSLGVIVGDFVDVVETPARPKRSGTRAGVLGTMVLQDRVAEVIDCDYLVGIACPPDQELRAAG